MEEPILRIRGLKTDFYTYEGAVKALDDVSFDLYKGETLGLVGETGCGKSVTALSIMQLVPEPGKIIDGKIMFKGKNLLGLNAEEMMKIRGKEIAMIFQDPLTYINPVLTIGDQIAEVIMFHRSLDRDVLEMKTKELEKTSQSDPASSKVDGLESKTERLKKMENPPKPSRQDLKKVTREKTLEMLRWVRMPYPEKVIDQYPHELSGGMRQRAVIAMALSCRPSLIICDEATTFLDVTVQAQILGLLQELKKEANLSVMFITHDLGIVAQFCDHIVVMYAGVIVEQTDVSKLFDNPLHPYTSGLLAAIPTFHRNKGRLNIIPGNVPNLINPPSGCRFHPRCPHAKAICKKEKPKMVEVIPEHFVACHIFSTPNEWGQ